MKRLVLRERARRDVEEAARWYLTEAGERQALAFAASLRATLRSIASRPGAGSPRWAVELDLPGLRSRRLRRFPYLVFYVEAGRDIDVWRVLHAHRDIPAWLIDDDA